VLGGTVTVKAVNGWATFSDLTLNLAGNYILGARSGKLTPDMSNTFTVVPVNVTSLVKIALGAVVAVGSGLFRQAVTLSNTSGKPISGPLAIVLQGLSAGEVLTNAAGSYRGSPYQRVVAIGHSLAAGKSLTFTLYFDFPGRRGPRSTDSGYSIEALLGL
jgi:hypothetical protein